MRITQRIFVNVFITRQDLTLTKYSFCIVLCVCVCVLNARTVPLQLLQGGGPGPLIFISLVI